MSAQLLAFPAEPPAAFPATGAPSRRRYRLHDVARLLGYDGVEGRTLIRRLRTLHRIDGMPLPIQPRIYGDAVYRDERAICSASTWDAQVFDAWRFDPRRPPAAGTGAPPPPIDLQAEMARRAVRLAGVAR